MISVSRSSVRARLRAFVARCAAYVATCASLVAQTPIGTTPLTPGSSENAATPATATSPLPDQQWASLLRTAQAIGPVKPTSALDPSSPPPQTRSSAPDPRTTRATQLRALAQQAREFNGRFPTHPQSAVARKLAVLADIEAILPNDAAHRRAAEAAATALRRDLNAPWTHRVEAAEALEHRSIQLKLPGHAWTTNPMLAEPMLDRLRVEFGDRPEIWARYLNLAESTNCDAGRDIAYRILQSPIAAPGTKAGAQRILERYALIRKPLDLPLLPVRGPATRIAALSAPGKATVIVVWDGTRQPAGPPGLSKYHEQARSDLTWIYISQGPIAPLPLGRPTAKYPAGLICIEPDVARGPSSQILKPPQLPYAYVLDSKKRLSGYGRLDEIDRLVAGMNRPALP